MTEELETVKKVVLILDECKVNYMLTGSMAMSFYTVPRLTRVSDIVIQLIENQTDSFVNSFEEEFYIDRGMVLDSINKNMMFNIFSKSNFFKIDFILKNNDEYENVKFERRKKLKINGFEVYVISIEDLILSKLEWAKASLSEMQLNDIKELMKNDFDEQYDNEWIQN